ncbi:MAG: DUF4160 domain-containing protein [Deltaproteobacteria bacterium]|nr:MAG: DUF4160 domain-containing protein [Deltaproteobacteria bacterium]
MPTVLRTGPYRLLFFSNEGTEPPHVHVRRDRCLAKFWLKPVTLASSTRFSAQELREVARVVQLHRAGILENWDEFFGA